MKTVKELIEFLQTQNQDMPVQIVYDGYQSELCVYIYENKLCFSNYVYNPEYEDADILFHSEVKR